MLCIPITRLKDNAGCIMTADRVVTIWTFCVLSKQYSSLMQYRLPANICSWKNTPESFECPQSNFLPSSS